MTGLEALNDLIEDLQQDNGVLIICKERVEKELKALDIIKEKCVGNDNLLLVKESINYKHYLGKAKLGIDNIVNTDLEEKDLLTEEEFNTLKEVLE